MGGAQAIGEGQARGTRSKAIGAGGQAMGVEGHAREQPFEYTDYNSEYTDYNSGTDVLSDHALVQPGQDGATAAGMQDTTDNGDTVARRGPFDCNMERYKAATGQC